LISLIICSRNREISPQLAENIAQTIGLAYETIFIDNSQSVHSIFSAYNLGASKAKYEYLCFLHDDILIRTTGWGNYIVNLLEDKKTGVVGVAGSIYASSVPSPWWISNFADMSAFLRCHYIHHTGKGKETNILPADTGQTRQLFEVVLLDGVWLCCRRNIWEELRFDEGYGGFHFYDLDFSMGVFAKGYHNYVTHRVLVEHFSSGHTDGKWVEAALVFNRKWKKLLPAGIGPVKREDRKLIKKEALRNMITITSGKKSGYSAWYRYWFQYFLDAPFQRLTYSLLRTRIRQWL
jgi:hypothetical protein